MVELDGKPTLSCVTPMSKIKGTAINTLEGFPENVREIIGRSFINKGAVQCGFCSSGILTRTKILLEANPSPTEEDIIKALRSNYCRCTGYKKIVEAVKTAADVLNGKSEEEPDKSGKVGSVLPKYGGYEKLMGTAPYVDDLRFEGMAFSALKFADHPRGRVININTSDAEKLDGVIRIFIWKDIPGERYFGLIYNDWPLMVAEGETTRYVGDVIAGVVAESEAKAREGVALISVEYEVLEPLTDMEKAEESSIKVHENGNLLETSNIRRGGNVNEILKNSPFIVSGRYETQRIEHAFLETEAAVAMPGSDGSLKVFSQSQGVYEDRRQISRILGIKEDKIAVSLLANGGGFGGKEDMTVQGHAALFSFYLKRPVKLKLSRDESMVMHPKRHPLIMDYEVSCNRDGYLTALRARIMGDTGAYASVGTKVLERAAGHATGAYHIPAVDIEAKTLYTNNIPSGAMRGFGVNQVTFALESCIDQLCKKAGFDRWKFRYENALKKGSETATGQVLGDGVGVRETLMAVKDEFYSADFCGIACGLKNCGIGNGMIDFSEIKIEIKAPEKVVLYHGWTEMGQGVNTVAVQVLSTETGIPPRFIDVKVSTADGAKAGMTTSSRGTSLIGNGIINASKKLKEDLKKNDLSGLVGNVYSGRWSFEDSTKPGASGKVVTHYSYSYATQLVILDEKGKINKIIAAHDGGKIINPILFEGQIEGAVHMGLGYALSEEFPLKGGFPVSTKMRDLGLIKIKDTPEIVVKGIEVADPLGPYGAKGIGEIGLVPTAAAVSNALFSFDGIIRRRLPLKNS